MARGVLGLRTIQLFAPFAKSKEPVQGAQRETVASETRTARP